MKHRKEIVERLNDCSASLKDWEDAAHYFLDSGGSSVRFRD